MNFLGELTAKVVLRNDQKKGDGTCAIYLQCFVRGEKLMISLRLYVKPSQWDKKTQRVRKNHKLFADYNLIIEQSRSRIHNIGLEYRLRDKILTKEILKREYYDPTPYIDFIKFCEYYNDQQKGVIEHGTWKAKKSCIQNIKRWRESWLFSEVTDKNLKEYQKHLRKRNLAEGTIQNQFKNIKSWLNAAEREGAKFDFEPKNLKVTQPRSMITFLTREELKKLHAYYKNDFCTDPHRKTLQVFLFGCYSGMRYQDLKNMSWNNLDGNRLTYVPNKTKKLGKFVSINLPQKAMDLLEKDHFEPFEKVYENQVMNRNLKEIARMTKIRKRISCHVSRHTFATIFMEIGGSIEVLNEIMAHSNIRETMIYVKVSNQRKDDQMKNFDLL